MVQEADKDIISSAIDFWRTLYDAGEAQVKFTKNDSKTIRIMKCTLDFKKIPKDQHPKNIDMAKIIKLMQKSGIIHVFDLEKKGWRSVPFNRIDWMKTKTKMYKIRPFSGFQTQEQVEPFNKKGIIE